MRHRGELSRLSRCSGWRWAGGWWLLLLFALLCFPVPPIANGQSGNPSELTASSGSLLEAEAILNQLASRLAERKLQVTSLQESLQRADSRLNDFALSLTALEARLQAAQESLSTSQADLTATLSSLDALSKRYEELNRLWLDYRSEMKGQVAGLERTARIWRVAGISGWVLAALATIAVLVH